jgi:hypothetical protein
LFEADHRSIIFPHSSLNSAARTLPVRVNAIRRSMVMLQAVAIALLQSSPMPAPCWIERHIGF